MSEMIKLSTICKIKGGTGFPEKYQGNKSAEYPVVKVSEMEIEGNKKYIKVANNYLDQKTAILLNATIFPKDTIVFAKVGAALLLNRRRILSRESILDNNMMGLIVASEVNVNFLYQFLLTFDLGMLVQTGALPSVNQQIVGNIEIPIPPLPQQRKIAKILTTVDNLIEKTESLIAKYQSIKKGMMHDLFTRGIDAKGKLRPPQSEAPELYKQSELGWIPKEWEAERLENHLDRIDQGWSPDCDSEQATVGEWGVLKTTAVVWNGFNDLENKKLPIHLKPEPKYEVKVNDVLMTRGGPNSRVGVVVFVNETRSRLMLSDKIYRILLKQSVLPNYIALALSSKNTQIHLSTLKTGLAESQTNISQKIVRQLFVSIPNLKEQLLICKHIRKTEDFLNRNFKNLLDWKTLKTALMQDLLTGKVQVIPDAEDKGLAHA